jgi:hypothetical protein
MMRNLKEMMEEALEKASSAMPMATIDKTSCAGVCDVMLRLFVEGLPSNQYVISDKELELLKQLSKQYETVELPHCPEHGEMWHMNPNTGKMVCMDGDCDNIADKIITNPYFGNI